MERKRILWVGDSNCPSGFARSTQGILETLYQFHDVTVLGMNYNGDPNPYPYPVYAAAAGGDSFGVRRLIWMCDLVKPDLIVIQQDPWNFPDYFAQLHKFEEYKDIPVVGIVAVDGKNCRGTMLNDLSLAVFWTNFGANEARLGGYKGASVVIPLGVDLKQYYPMDKAEARRRLGLNQELLDWFIVGTVNRNQPRKRLDLTIEYFAEWRRKNNVPKSLLWMHVAPTGDTDGVDCEQLAQYYGAPIVYVQPPTFYGLLEDVLRDTYNAFDVCLNTSQGEGFGLTTFEAMACGVPQILPDWAAHSELCYGAAWMIPCTSFAATNSRINSIGGVMDKARAIEALQSLYEDRQEQTSLSELGLRLVSQPQFRWSNIGREFTNAIEPILMKEVAA